MSNIRKEFPLFRKDQADGSIFNKKVSYKSHSSYTPHYKPSFIDGIFFLMVGLLTLVMLLTILSSGRHKIKAVILFMPALLIQVAYIITRYCSKTWRSYE